MRGSGSELIEDERFRDIRENTVTREVCYFVALVGVYFKIEVLFN